MSRCRLAFLRVALKLSWSVGGAADAVDGLPRLSGPDVNGMLGVLKPGDFVLLGNNGRLSHVAVHTGDGEIVHAMATEKTMRGWLGSVRDAFARVFGGSERVGVLHERLDAFLARYERDTWAVVRPPEIAPDALGRGLERVRSLVGQPYDYGFRAANEAWYCTELVEEFLKAALGEAAPAIPRTPVRVPLLLAEQVMEPAALLGADGLKPVAANRAALTHYREHVEAVIV
ncbi:MAG: YiiX/YebB-like N1pC/P60 family cysteine hydrolase [Myxococcota bacterium]